MEGRVGRVRDFCFVDNQSEVKIMRYKIGDQVKISSKLVNGRYYTMEGEDKAYCFFTAKMQCYKGLKAKIVDVEFHEEYHIYKLDIDNGHWSWVDEMFDAFNSLK